LSEVEYGNGVFAAVCDSENCTVGAVSPDGVKWTPSTLPIGGYYEALCFSNGTFFSSGAVYNGTKSVGAISTNGLTWNATELPSHKYWNANACGDGVIMALADDNEQTAAVGKVNN